MSHQKNIKPIPVMGISTETFIKDQSLSNSSENRSTTRENKQQKQENTFAIPKTPKENKNIIVPQKNPREIKEFNSMLACRLCKGYIIEATTINECLHTFCRSCLVKYIDRYKACPKCRSTTGKPITLSNLRPDRALRSLIYKIVPGLYQSECQRLIKFNIGHGGSDCKTQMRGISPIPIHTNFEREIQNHSDEEDYYQEYYSPDELISLSLEYHPESVIGIDETVFIIPPIRYLKCQAACTVSILYRFLASKYALNLANNSSETLKDYHKIEVIHKGEILPESFTLMDIAYCYNWQRLAPLRLFYRIFSYTIEDNEQEPQQPHLVDANINNLKIQSLTDLMTVKADSSTMVSDDKCIKANTLIKNNTSNKNNSDNNRNTINIKTKNEKFNDKKNMVMELHDKVQSDSNIFNIKSRIKDYGSSINTGLTIKQNTEIDNIEKGLEKFNNNNNNNNNKQLHIDNKNIKSEYNDTSDQASHIGNNNNESNMKNKHVRINIKREACDFGIFESYNCETLSTPANIKDTKDTDFKEIKIKSPNRNTMENMRPIIMKKQNVIPKRSDNLSKSVVEGCQSQKITKTNNDFKRLRSNDVKYDYIEPEPVVPEAYTSSRLSIKNGTGNKLSRSSSDGLVRQKESNVDTVPRRSISLVDNTKHKIIVPSLSQIKSENDFPDVKKNFTNTKLQYKDFALTKKIIVPKIEKKLSPDDVPMKFYIKTSPTASEINSSRIDTSSRSGDLLSKNRVDFAKNIGLKPNFSLEGQNNLTSTVPTHKTEEGNDKSTHRKRKKGKHSKEAGGKRRKLHAEIATQDESLKLKLKITGSKQYSSRHERKSAPSTDYVSQKNEKAEKLNFNENGKNSKSIDIPQTDVKTIRQKPSINIPNLNETLSEASTSISNLIKISEIRGQIEPQSHLPTSQHENVNLVQCESKSPPTASLVNTTKPKPSSPVITSQKQELKERNLEVPPLKLSQLSKEFVTTIANNSGNQPIIITSKNSIISDINKLNILSSTSIASSTTVASYSQRYFSNCMRYSTPHSLPNSPHLSPISSGSNGNSTVLNIMSPKDIALAVKRSMSLDSGSPANKYPRMDVSSDSKQSIDGNIIQMKNKKNIINDQKQNGNRSLKTIKTLSPPLQGIVKNQSSQLHQLKLVPNEQINKTTICTSRVMPTKPVPIILPPASMSVTKMSDLLPSLIIPCDKRPAMEIVRITSPSTTTESLQQAKKCLIPSPKPTLPLKSPGIVQQKLLMPKTTRPMPPTIPLIKIKKSATQIVQQGQPQTVRDILTKSHQQQTEQNIKKTDLPVSINSTLSSITNKLSLMTSQEQSEQNCTNGDQKQTEKSQKQQQYQNNKPKHVETKNNTAEKEENDYKPVCDNFGALDLSGKSSRSPSGETSPPPSSPVSVSPKPCFGNRAPGSPQSTITNGGMKSSTDNKATDTKRNEKHEKILNSIPINSTLNESMFKPNEQKKSELQKSNKVAQLTSLQNLKMLSESANVCEKLSIMKQAVTCSTTTASTITSSVTLPSSSEPFKLAAQTETSLKRSSPPSRQHQIPKLNEISKIRPAIRQQNPSVRNIPNPSALAFRNHNNNLSTNVSVTMADSLLSKGNSNEAAVMTSSTVTVASITEPIATITNNSIPTTLSSALKIVTNSLHTRVPSPKDSNMSVSNTGSSPLIITMRTSSPGTTTSTPTPSSIYSFKTTNFPTVSSTAATHDICKMLNNNNNNNNNNDIKNFNNNNSASVKKIFNFPSTTSNTPAASCGTALTVTSIKKTSSPSLSMITSNRMSPSTAVAAVESVGTLKSTSTGDILPISSASTVTLTTTVKTDAQLIAEKKNLHIEQLAANLRAAAANSNELVSSSTSNERN